MRIAYLLNSLACGGQTASNFATACAKNAAGTGYDAVLPKGPHLYVGADSSEQLLTALKGIVASLVCTK